MVRTDITPGTYYCNGNSVGREVANNEMADLAGEYVTISKMGEGWYRILEDEEEWYWTESMFTREDYSNPFEDTPEMESFISSLKGW